MNFSSGIAIIFVVIGALVSQSQAAQATNSLRGLSEGPPDCRYGGKDYYANEWRVDCQLGKFDMCQCVYDWRKKGYRWSNCRNNAKKCSQKQPQYKNCSMCMKYESNNYCLSKGYCSRHGDTGNNSGPFRPPEAKRYKNCRSCMDKCEEKFRSWSDRRNCKENTCRAFYGRSTCKN